MSESVQGLEVRVRAVAKALTKEEESATKLRLAGYSTAQIADAMGQDAATVRRWLTRVQELLAAEERAAEERAAASAPAQVPAQRWLPLEWEERLAAVAWRGAVRQVEGAVSGEELKVIVLRLEGLNESEIARQLGVGVSAVHMRLVRVRQRLDAHAPELARRLWSSRSRR